MPFPPGRTLARSSLGWMHSCHSARQTQCAVCPAMGPAESRANTAPRVTTRNPSKAASECNTQHAACNMCQPADPSKAVESPESSHGPMRGVALRCTALRKKGEGGLVVEVPMRPCGAGLACSDNNATSPEPSHTARTSGRCTALSNVQAAPHRTTQPNPQSLVSAVANGLLETKESAHTDPQRNVRVAAAW